MIWFGQFIYPALLLTNAVAILNEERFLAKIGWSTRSVHAANAGFGHAPQGSGLYDGGGYGGAPNEGESIKVKAIQLISAIRTVMRIPLIAVNVVIIIYELLLG